VIDRVICAVDIGVMRFLGPERPCEPNPVCLTIPAGMGEIDDGLTCEIPSTACLWACNGTCFDDNSATAAGTIYIAAEQRNENVLARYANNLIRN